MIIILALQPVPRKLKLLSNIPSLTRIVLISPCVAKSDLKINAYDTSDVAHGKKYTCTEKSFKFKMLVVK